MELSCSTRWKVLLTLLSLCPLCPHCREWQRALWCWVWQLLYECWASLAHRKEHMVKSKMMHSYPSTQMLHFFGTAHLRILPQGLLRANVKGRRWVGGKKTYSMHEAQQLHYSRDRPANYIHISLPFKICMLLLLDLWILPIYKVKINKKMKLYINSAL